MRPVSLIACALALLLPSCAVSRTDAQAAEPKISAAPGGVPVPPIPASSVQAAITANAAPLAGVFRVRMLDGRNGAPVPRAHLRLWYDETGSTAFALTTNEQGIALLPEPVGMPVRVLVQPDDRIDCRRTQRTANEPLQATNMAVLAESGSVAANHCGPSTQKPRPGELVLFVRPLRWYEGLNRP